MPAVRGRAATCGRCGVATMRPGAAGGSAAPAPPPFVPCSALAQGGGSGPGLLAVGLGSAAAAAWLAAPCSRRALGWRNRSRSGSAAFRGWLEGGFSKAGPIWKWPRLSRRSCAKGLGGLRGWFPHGCRPSSRGASRGGGRVGGAAAGSCPHAALMGSSGW